MSFPFLLAVAVAQEPPAPMGDFFCVDGPIPPVSKTAFANNDPITAAQLLSVRLLNLHFQQEGQGRQQIVSPHATDWPHWHLRQLDATPSLPG